MTRAQFDSCRENRGMINALNGIKERGRTLGIIGTPNFFIQGKLVKSVIGMKEIREMVDPILAGRVAASRRRRRQPAEPPVRACPTVVACVASRRTFLACLEDSQVRCTSTGSGSSASSRSSSRPTC